MGIVRYPIRCAGCGASLRLRLTVGIDSRQPFYFPCPVCKAPTRGALNWHGGAETSLDLESGELLDEDVDGAPAVSISADIPSVPDALTMTAPGGSAFMRFAGLIGPDAMKRLIATRDESHEKRRELEPLLARLVTYYQNGDHKRFDSNVNPFLPEGVAPSADWHRADILHRLLDLLVVPVLVLEDWTAYPEMKAEFNGLWSSDAANAALLRVFAKREGRSPSLRTVHRDVFALLNRYVSNISAMLPGAMCNMVPPESQFEIGTLRLLRDDFEPLRDLYVNAFETSHKALSWIIGAANIVQRGAVDAFVTPPDLTPGGRVAASMKQYDRLANAERRKYLYCLPVWNAKWDEIFDRPLRNDFGHTSARHDLTTGSVHRDGRPDLPYTRFVQRVHRVGHGLLACANALKIIRIYADDSFVEPPGPISSSA